MAAESLSLREARLLALAAQGFDKPKPDRPPQLRDVRRVILQLGLLQIDYVNVVAPAHYLILFSRLGPYRKSLLDELVYKKREFIEQWAHEASIVPVSSWPLLRHRRDEHRVRPYGFEKFIVEYPQYVSEVIGHIKARGPLRADDLHTPEGAEKWLEHSWFRSVPRAVLEAHFGQGTLAVSERHADFARTYDLAERVVAAQHHGRSVSRVDAQRELLRLASRSCGVATASDLADYYRMPVKEARPRLTELVESGNLAMVKVESWREPAYLDVKAKLPLKIDAAALLAPFDPLIWFRPRASRLFQFDYRFEIFIPEAKRLWGAYVFPFLLGDRLVARVDLKSDRVHKRLLVLASYLEPGVDGETVVAPLASELRALAKWLALETVTVRSKSAFSKSLSKKLCSTTL